MNLQMFHKFNTKTNTIRVFVFFFFLILTNFQLCAQNKIYTVVLDAGHGGKDPGKVGYKKYKEKDIALKIVLGIGKILEANENIKVVYTRKTDIFVELSERGKIANKADADLFVSIHCNAHTSQAYGAETWVLGLNGNKKNFAVAKAENNVIVLYEDNYKDNYKGFDPDSPESVIGITLMQEEYLDQSLQLASIVQDNFANKLNRKSRGVKQAGFVVLHQTYMPSILIETGFITNKIEGTYLNSKKGQLKFAKTIASGIGEYLKQLDLNTVINKDVVENTMSSDKKYQMYKDITFKVQIASGRKLETKSYNFKGFKEVERVKIGRSYKYYLGNTSDFNIAKDYQKKAREKGYTTAYIVAFKNGQKISVTEALKTAH